MRAALRRRGLAWNGERDPTPLLVPRLSPYRDQESHQAKFDASLYRRYREYQAALGLIAAWALLALKAVYFK